MTIALSHVQALALFLLPGGEAVPQFSERGDAFFQGGEPLSLTTTCGSPRKDFIVEVNGGGLVLADFDTDGDPDLVVVDGSTLERAVAGEPGEPPRLLLNRGDGRFDLAGGEWGMSGGRWGTGGASGDVDGDGDPDLVVTQWGPDRLFLNDGGEGLREVEEPFRGKRWGTSAAFLDYDLDGQLDLVVVNYLAFYPDEVQGKADGACRWKGHPVMCGPEGLSPVHDQLYRGDGRGGFTETTRPAGFQARDAGYGLGAITLDYDLDGDTDVYVSNDSTPNHLWVNGGDGTFEEQGLALSVSHAPGGREEAGMGIACGDLDGDEYPDLFVTNFSGEPNRFYASRPSDRGVRYRNNTDRLALGGPSMLYLGWGTALEDFDLDGDRDLFVLNGHVYPEADRAGTDTSYAQPDHLYRNTGGRFAQESLSDGPPRVSRAGVAADLDADGDPDIVAVELDGEIRVLENRGGPGHWLSVTLTQEGGNSSALGATITAVVADGLLVGEVRTAGGFQTSVPPAVHLGLGEHDGPLELRVRWPGGHVTRHTVQEVDRAIEVVRPAEEPAAEEDE